MADRFERLFSLPNDLFTNDTPIIIMAGALLKDQQTGAIIAQIKFQSLSNKTIKAVKLSLSAYDITGKQVTGVEDYQYLDMAVNTGEVFGAEKAIIMPNYNSRSFAIVSIMVVFSDNSTWECQGNMLYSLPAPQLLNTKISTELIQQYKIATTEQANYVPQELGVAWRCTCGVSFGIAM